MKTAIALMVLAMLMTEAGARPKMYEAIVQSAPIMYQRKEG